MKNQGLLGLASLLAVACGATEAVPEPVSTPEPTQPAPVAAPTPAPVVPELDHGALSETYPAFAPEMGQIMNHGGSVLKNPVVVTVTWPGDDKADQLEALGDAIGAGQYWKDVTSEYGVGAGSSGAEHHLRLTETAPASMSDKQLDAFVAQSLSRAEAPWPATSGNPVYILYLAKATTLMLSGKSACSQGIGGYHSSTKVNGSSVAYAIVPRCGNSFERITVAASHELAEAATDPYPNSRPAYVGFKEEHLAWDIFQQFQSENGDACEFYRDSNLEASENDVGFTLQRQWSNASGKAGHDPCVPAFKNTTYFNVTPLGLEDIDVDLSSIGGSETTTKGYKVKVGETRQIPLGFYSDRPLTPWTIKAITGGITGGRSSGGVDLELDVTSGQNGQKAYLSVTVNTAGTTGSELVTVVSTRAGVSHYMPFLIGRP